MAEESRTKEQLIRELAQARRRVAELERSEAQRKRAEESLWESEKRFRSIAETASDAIIIFDSQENIFFWNQAAQRIFGYRAGETRGQLLASIMSDESSELFRQAMRQVISAEESDLIGKTVEAVGVRKDGSEFPAEISLATWETKEEVYFTFIARDITARKQAEQALARQAQELARSNAELEQFAYVASHDLREPLLVVNSYLELLKRRYKDRLDADANDFIARALHGTDRMQALINDLLEYSRVGTHGKPLEPTDCTAALDGALANLKVAIETSGAVITHDALPRVLADEMQLTQLFQNLISNAVKFRGDNPPEVHIGVEHRDNEWLFSVRDNGIGIAPPHQDRIFRIFQRLHTREEYPGTGIGLAVCKKIVERHGGRIWVESLPGEGSTFFFTIPSIGDKAGVL